MNHDNHLTASASSLALANSRGLFMPLDHLGLMAAEGEDAESFLHNQLTNDMQSLGLNEARLAGYCLPKGRLLASFLCWKTEHGIMLQCPLEIQAAMQKRLGMFIMRSKLKLADASPTWHVYGMAGDGARTFLRRHFDALPEDVWQLSRAPAGVLIRMPDSMGLARWQWLLAADRPNASETAEHLNTADSSLWRWLEIRAGLPSITTATQERFIPQAINFEALGGVNFKKGCYPGQEVVARSQYLGKLKRRMVIAHLDVPTKQDIQLAGRDVMAGSGEPAPTQATQATQAIGSVVNAELAPAGGLDLLIEIPVTYMEGEAFQEPLQVEGIDHALLKKIALPYALPDQDIFIRPKL